MKQTAVEWLVKQIKEGNIYKFSSLDEIIEQAKEMEKEQIENAFKKGQESTQKHV